MNNVIYAVCFTKNSPGKDPEVEFEYLHAPNRREAELGFRTAHSQALITGRYTVIEVAPAIGVHAKDDNGDQLVM
jgi:hypothetical protein